jgi:hypothetical protein
MVDRLFVVVGAGATRGCAPENVPRNLGYLPPLVTDLFQPGQSHLSEVLAKYPLAKLAAADLRGVGDSLAIEEVIRTRYRDSEQDLDQRIFRGIPPYLQEQLHTVSYEYSGFPQNYESLVTNLLRLPEVIFISLNYDVVLDRVLTSVTPLIGSISWYIQPDRNWSMVKLHGSVNWVRHSNLNEGTLFTDPPEDLQLDEEIVLRPMDELWKIRGLSGPSGGFAHGDLHYPVLSVPIGEADELACPDTHVDFLKSKLDASQPLHLLFVGYSGNDEEVISLIRDSGRGIKTLTVVDTSREASEAVFTRLNERHGLQAEEIGLSEVAFDGWVASGELQRYVESLTARPF